MKMGKDHTIVCAASGASSNFLAYLIADYNGEADNVVYLPHNNEYRLWMKPYWFTSGVKPDNLVTMSFNGKQWISEDRVGESLLTSCVSRMHPYEGYLPPETINNIAAVTSKLYYIRSVKTEYYTKVLAAIKNIVLKYILGQSQYLDDLGKLFRTQLVVDKFVDYYQRYKELNILGVATTTISMNYFHNVYLKTNRLELEEYKQYVRDGVAHYIENLEDEKDFDIPKPLKNVTVELDYYKLVVKQEPTGTVFDLYQDEIKDYHQRNVELIQKVCGFYEIPVDFLDDL